MGIMTKIMHAEDQPIELIDHDGLRYVETRLTSKGVEIHLYENPELISNVIAMRSHRAWIQRKNIQEFT